MTMWRTGSRAAARLGCGLAVLGALAIASPSAAQRVPERFGPVPRFAWGHAASSTYAVPAAALRDSQSTAAAGGLFVAQTIGGTLGSVAGIYLGARAGSAYYERHGSSCGCDDPGLGEGVLGAAIGSVVGTALFSHVSARMVGARGGQWPNRLSAAALGILAGIGAVAVLHADPDNGLPSLLVFPVTQALVTALATAGQ